MQRTQKLGFPRQLLQARSVQVFIAGWFLASIALVAIAQRTADLNPFNLPPIAMVVRLQVGMLSFLAFVGLIYLLTRNRPVPDFAARAPAKPLALRETALLLAYGVGAVMLLGVNGIGLHLPGSILNPNHHLVPQQVWVWMGINFVVYGVIPYIFFRRLGYTHEQMGLKSNNPKSDALVIVTVLVAEVALETAIFGGRLFRLTGTQLLAGVPLTLLVHLLGTGIPIMILIYSLLFPRYVTLVGPVGAVILGGLTYATFHLFESATLYDTLKHGAFSTLLVYLQFTGAGLIKSMMTLRTGNAWAHMIGYHVVAPHLLNDTTLIVNTFRIR